MKEKIGKIYTGLKIAVSALESDGIMDPSIALPAILDRRFSNPTDHKKSLESLIFMERDDFPSLSNREEITIDKRLRGYLYKTDLAKGIVLFVHGINSFSDDYYAIGQDYLVRHGYDVLALDLSSSGNSKGHGVKSLSQGAIDVAEAVKYIQKREDLKNMPLYMFGHSWGAYSVAASLNFVSGVKAIACLSGFVTPLDEMIALPSNYIGPLADMTYEPLSKALEERAGQYYNLSAIDGINKEKSTKVLVVQGGNDSTVSPKNGSIYSEINKINRKIETLYLPGKGHANVFLSDQSIEYLSQVNEMKADFKKRYGSNLNKINPEAIEEFKSSFNKALTSVPDGEVFSKMISIFQ